MIDYRDFNNQLLFPCKHSLGIYSVSVSLQLTSTAESTFLVLSYMRRRLSFTNLTSRESELLNLKERDYLRGEAVYCGILHWILKDRA